MLHTHRNVVFPLLAGLGLALSGCGLNDELPNNKGYIVFDLPGDPSPGAVYDRGNASTYIFIRYQLPVAAPIARIVINLGRADYVNTTAFSPTPVLNPDAQAKDAEVKLTDVPLCELADPNIGAVYRYAFYDVNGNVVSSSSFVNTSKHNFCR